MRRRLFFVSPAGSFRRRGHRFPKEKALAEAPWSAPLPAHDPLCEATADVRVHVRRSVVEIEVEQAVVRAVVPVAAIEAMPLPVLPGILR